MQSNTTDSEASAQPVFGLYFGAATLYGLLGWAILQGKEGITMNCVWSVTGIVLFAVLSVTEKKLRRRLRVSLNYGGYLFTILSIVYLGYRMWTES